MDTRFIPVWRQSWKFHWPRKLHVCRAGVLLSLYFEKLWAEVSRLLGAGSPQPLASVGLRLPEVDAVVMARAAVLLLGLFVSCHAQVAPPSLNVSLDEEPEVRWQPLLTVFDVEYLKKAGAEVIE